jgi:hypothetical protein
MITIISSATFPNNWRTWSHPILDVSCKLLDRACIVCRVIWYVLKREGTLPCTKHVAQFLQVEVNIYIYIYILLF